MEPKCRCGKSLEQPAGAGRPPTYCGTACRRAAEFEIRRLDKLLARLEDRLVDLRLRSFSIEREGVEAARITAEVELAHRRMVVLLDDA